MTEVPARGLLFCTVLLHIPCYQLYCGVIWLQMKGFQHSVVHHLTVYSTASCISVGSTTIKLLTCRLLLLWYTKTRGGTHSAGFSQFITCETRDTPDGLFQHDEQPEMTHLHQTQAAVSEYTTPSELAITSCTAAKYQNIQHLARVIQCLFRESTPYKSTHPTQCGGHHNSLLKPPRPTC